MRRLLLSALLVIGLLPASLPAATALADDPTEPAPTEAPPSPPATTEPPPTTTLPEPQPQPNAGNPGSSHGQGHAGGITQDVTIPETGDRKGGKPKDRINGKKGQEGKEDVRAKGSDRLPEDIGLPGPGGLTITAAILGGYDVPPAIIPAVEAAGAKYGIPPAYLLAILKIESAFCFNMGPSSAGAIGCGQFLRSSLKTYGTDPNEDGYSDPANFVDATDSMARYLKAAGFDRSVDKAIFAYNHADWYVREVKHLARFYARRELITHKIGSLMQGVPPIVGTAASYRDENKPDVVIDAAAGAPVVASTDGTVDLLQRNPDGSHKLVLRDVWGNRIIYRNLRGIPEAVPNPKIQNLSREALKRQFEDDQADEKLPKPTGPAAPASRPPGTHDTEQTDSQPATAAAAKAKTGARNFVVTTRVPPKQRFFANPQRKSVRDLALAHGQAEDVLTRQEQRNYYKTYLTPKKVSDLPADEFELKRLAPGTTVMAGTPIGESSERGLNFEVRPDGVKAGDKGTNTAAILKNWTALERAGIAQVTGTSPLLGGNEGELTPSQVLLMSKPQLERLVLLMPTIEIYEPGRRDISEGRICDCVLRAVAYLAAKGLRPSISSLMTGHSVYVGGTDRVSHHATGRAADISAFNDEPVLGHQEGDETYTADAIRSLMALPPVLRPVELISLYNLGGPSLAMGNHDDHLHIGYSERGKGSSASATTASLDERRKSDKFGPHKWQIIMRSMDRSDVPPVPKQGHPTKWAIRVKKKHEQPDKP